VCASTTDGRARHRATQRLLRRATQTVLGRPDLALRLPREAGRSSPEYARQHQPGQRTRHRKLISAATSEPVQPPMSPHQATSFKPTECGKDGCGVPKLASWLQITDFSGTHRLLVPHTFERAGTVSKPKGGASVASLTLLTTTTRAVHHRCITATAFGAVSRNKKPARYRMVKPNLPVR
jgi:hypothetical protein